MTTTQSLMSRTMSMSCSTNSTVMPCSRRSLTCPSSDCVSAGFTPAIGSSSITIVGSTMSARAISSSLRWPPDRLPAKSCSLASSLKRAQQVAGPLVDLLLLAGPDAGDQRAEEVLALLAGRAQAHVVEDRQLRQRLGELEGADHAAAGDLVRRHAGQVLALERPGALVGPVEAGEQVEEGGLAGAVRADERGDDAALHLEVVDLDGGQAAEAAGHAVGDQDRVGLGDAGAGLDAGERRRQRRAGRRRSRTVVGRGRASAGIEGQLLLVAEDPLRAEDHEQPSAGPRPG